jgi:hypothetical protein
VVLIAHRASYDLHDCDVADCLFLLDYAYLPDTYQPPVPSSHAAGPLSPSTSNSDAGEHSDAGTYSPPKLPQSAGRSQVTPQASFAAALGIAPGSRGDGECCCEKHLLC